VTLLVDSAICNREFDRPAPFKRRTRKVTGGRVDGASAYHALQGISRVGGNLMAHRTFFSFYYDDDIWRATNVRKCGALSSGDIEFIDASLWEEAQAKGEATVKALIDAALARATVTAVLIGANTASRKWVKYEISESIRLGKGLFGVHVYRIKDQNSKESAQGANPLPAGYPVYLWNTNKGEENLGKWVDAAFDAAK